MTLLPTSVPLLESEHAGSGLVGISAPTGTVVTLKQVEPIAPGPLPEEATPLLGTVDYKVAGLPVGGTVEITLFAPNSSNVLEYEGGQYVDITPLTSSYGYDRIVLLTDGLFGDADHEANGVIDDVLVPIGASNQPGPRLTKLSATKAPASGGTSIVLSGKNLSKVTSVKFGDTMAASFEMLSSTAIRVVTPAATAGKVQLTVAAVGFALSNAKGFKFEGPTVTGISPNSGSTSGGDDVLISGAGFAPGSDATEFRFGGSLATDVFCASSTECTLQTPAGRTGMVDVVAVVAGKKGKKLAGDRYVYR